MCQPIRSIVALPIQHCTSASQRLCLEGVLVLEKVTQFVTQNYESNELIISSINVSRVLYKTTFLYSLFRQKEGPIYHVGSSHIPTAQQLFKLANRVLDQTLFITLVVFGQDFNYEPFLRHTLSSLKSTGESLKRSHVISPTLAFKLSVKP